jgi:hypothetical protein
VPLLAAAVCPHPPLIVPEIAVGAAAESADLRSACDVAVEHLLASAARTILVVGGDVVTREYSYPFRGSFAAWGADVEVDLGHPGADEPGETLPLSLLTGGWLLTRSTGPSAGRSWRMVGVATDETPDRCANYGAAQGSDHQPWAMLVMGDGSACRGPKSPGYDDPRAEPYDLGVARALADADPDALLRLDPEVSAQLKVAGRAPWQVLAGAARAAGTPWRGELLHHTAPYGVAYLVATWTPA